MKSLHVGFTLAIAGGLMGPTNAEADHLAGPAREAFIANTAQACVSASTPEKTGRMPADAVRSYCLCYATRIVDRSTVAEIQAGPAAPGGKRLSNETVKICYDALPEDKKK